MQRTFLLLFFLLISWLSFSQKYAFVTYSKKQGLPQTQVTAIAQDNSGYLWVGTLGGLARFNGESFETYSTNHGLLNNRIKTLTYFEETLWVGHDGGISLIQNEKIKSIPFRGNDKSRNVSGIIRFGNELIVSSNGGGLFHLVNDELKRIELNDPEYERVRDVFVYEGKLLLATRAGILVTENVKDFTFYEGLPQGTYSGIAGSDKYQVFSTYNDGIFVKDLSTGRIQSYSPEEIRYNVLGCFIDHKNKIWLNTGEGIVTIDPEKKKVAYLNENNGLPVGMISGFYEDQDGNMWIGSQGKGLIRFPGVAFTFYDQSTGLPSDLYLCGFQKRSGDFYLGTFDKGIVHIKKNGEAVRLDITENSIWTALPDVNGRDWFGTQSSLIAIDRSGKDEVYTIDDGLPGVKITALYKINNTSMYIGGSEGVSVYDGREFKRVGTERSSFIGTVRDFAILNDSLYCVSNLGVFVLRGNDFEQLDGINQVVYNLEKDQFGNLWFGTEEGLFRITNKKIERIHLLDDPASNIINFLNFRKGELFVGTNNGLFILSELRTKEPKVKRFGMGEGVIDLETNLNSGFFDRTDQFWFGTASGLISFHKSKSEKKASPPILNLKAIKLNYQPFDYATYTDSINSKGLPSDLTLPYSKNNLIFELDGVSLVHHHGLRYQFLLEGLNEEWSPLTEVASITFTSLPAGVYNLHMRAVDVDGRMSRELIFPFVVNQAFYKTWWFILLIVLIIGLIVLQIFRLRERRIREHNEKEKLEFKTRLLSLEQKSVNASMNRHFIFNALNSIQYFINTRDRESANKYLTNFAQLIRKNLDSANSDSNAISLEEELARIRLYLSLESMRFKGRFDYDIEVDDIDTESILIPSMIMQPFVENSIIHGILPNEGVHGEIRIKVYKEGTLLNILIEDNGIGINQSLSKKTIMEGDHRSQGMEITSKRIELIRKLSNNSIDLIGPEEIKGNDGSINGTRVLLKIRVEDLEN